jgi:lipopolysaccharide/colanic/teichoic acid biosynthesis glycosyltransferase
MHKAAREVAERQVMESREYYKRPFDLSILVVSHILLGPLFLLLWTLIPLAIWLEDRGPIFYSQTRIGRGGGKFRLLKFRSMRQNQAEGEPTILATEDDPRVTRVGRILRRTALDELPQVLTSMSVSWKIRHHRPFCNAFIAQDTSRVLKKPAQITRKGIKRRYNTPNGGRLR